MRTPRFNIATVLAVILVLGVGLAGLRESTDLWESGLLSGTLFILLISILLAIHRTDKRRAFWLGFALFGWAYLGLSLVQPIESRLVSTKLLASLGSKTPRQNSFGLAYFDYDNDGSVDIFVANHSQQNVLYRNNGNGTFQDVTASAGLSPAVKLSNIWAGPVGPTGTTENFVRIGHSLFALLAAFLGGQLSRFLCKKTVDPPVPINARARLEEPAQRAHGQVLEPAAGESMGVGELGRAC
jgi:hypothetical protein